MSHYTLLTGTTGLVGRYLLRDMLLEGKRLAVLVRRSKKETAQERTEAILQMWEDQVGRVLPRPVCIEGDISQPDLGISESRRRWLATHCERVIHNAAVLTFFGNSRSEEPWVTNIGGTQNVLELCRTLGIRDFHYVSTAYVCGTREGVIFENELECGQTFRNDYEHSKFLAEGMVREATFFDQITIYRPAVIAGDSTTGYTNTYHGLYNYLRLMSTLVWNEEPGPDGRRYTPVRLNMNGDEKRNVVPVDWVSKVFCRLYDTSEAHGGTYHFAPKVPITPHDVIEAGYKYFNSYGVEFVGPDTSVSDAPKAMEQAFEQNRTIYQPYESTDPAFDTTNTDRFTADLPCPVIDEAMLHRFWKYGDDDRWGKRRQPKVSVPYWIGNRLQERCRQHDRATLSLSSGEVATIGLDILGPGGGQWQVSVGEDQIERLEGGLPRKPSAILRMSAERFHALASLPIREAKSRLERCLVCHNGETADLLADRIYWTIVSKEEAESGNSSMPAA